MLKKERKNKPETVKVESVSSNISPIELKKDLELTSLRKKVSLLKKELNNLSKQRESLVRLVTHKVKSSFTRSKYIFAGLLDGTFGKTSPEIKKYAKQGIESDDAGIQTIDLVLNAANLQKGVVRYDMKKINFREVIENTLAEKRIQAEAKGLQMKSVIEENNIYDIIGDVFWIREAISNLIDNSIKYTQTGKITLRLKKEDGKIKLSIKDTGVGFTEEDKKKLFTEGGRGQNAIKINVDSTGYGLFSVRLIVEAHKGKVWAESPGVNQGSTFYIELDATKE